jgi:hypothetical protein
VYHYDALSAPNSQSDIHARSRHTADGDQGAGIEMQNWNESRTEASAKPEEAIFAQVAAQGHQTDVLQ